MDFGNLTASQMEYNATRCANDFVFTAWDNRLRVFSLGTSVCETNINLDRLREERLSERKRIAQELHDTLLQGFLAVSMNLHAAVDRLSEDCAEKQRFGDVIQLLDRVLEEGRCAVRGLRSPAKRMGSLGEALARVPNDLGFPPTAGFRVAVLGTERALREGLYEEVYRIGSEAIVNACRHSRASEIEVEVEYRPTELRIAVRDNGCGMAPQDVQCGRDGHWGLKGMRERAERVDARLRLWSRVAIGTEVELCVPGRVAFVQTQSQAAH